MGNCQLKKNPTTDQEAIEAENEEKYGCGTSFCKRSRVIPALIDTEPFIWVKLSKLSTSHTIPPEEAEKQIQADGLLEDHEMKQFLDNVEAMKCLLFLYCNSYFSEKPQRERVKLVKQCILPKQNRARLVRIALVDTSDFVVKTKDPFGDFCNAAGTAHLLVAAKFGFVSDGLTLFRNNPFLRIQTSNTCYIVAACVWYSLILQERSPAGDDKNKYPIDVSKCARKFLRGNDDELVKRVVHNGGGQAVHFLQSLAGTKSAIHWVSVEYTSPEHTASGQLTLQYLKSYGVGIVTQFRPPQQFKPRHKQKQSGYGYWAFMGSDENCEGEWQTLKPNSDQQQELERKKMEWETTWDQTKRERCASMPPKQLFQGNPQADKEQEPATKLPVGKGEQQQQQQQQQQPKGHAMVLLTGYKKDEKFYFFLLNSWVKMPLILVSADYLLACGCTIYFLRSDATLHGELERNSEFYNECCLLDDGDDGAYVSFESFDDGLNEC